MTIKVILGFDPGDTTGMCIVAEDGGVHFLGQYSLKDFIEWAGNFDPSADNFKVTHIIYERYIVFRQKAIQQTGSKMQVAQAIGVIKMLAARLKVPVIEQGPDIKAVALKWSGISMPSQHSKTHQWDAYLHAYYWLRKNGYIKSQVKGLVDD